MHVERYKAPSHVKANPSEFVLYSFAIGKNKYYNKSVSDTVRILKTYTNSLTLNLETAIQLHTELLNIRQKSYGLVATSDFMAGAKLPPLSIWDTLKSQVNFLKCSNLTNNIQVALKLLRYMSLNYEEAYQKLTLYMNRNQKGYAVAIETLTFIKGGAETIIGAYNPYIGGVYTAGLKVITQVQELNYNMRDEIDFEGIAIELVIDELFSLALDKISGKVIEQMKLPAVQQQLPFTIKDKLNNLLLMAPNLSKKLIVKGIINKFGNVITDCLKTIIQQKKNSEQRITWELITNTVAEQFTREQMLKNVIEEVLSMSMEK